MSIFVWKFLSTAKKILDKCPIFYCYRPVYLTITASVFEYSAFNKESIVIVTGKSNYFYWIDNSFRWVDLCGHGHIFYEWIGHFKPNRNSLSSRKLWLGHCSNNKCRRIRVHAHHCRFENYLIIGGTNEITHILHCRIECGAKRGSRIQHIRNVSERI